MKPDSQKIQDLEQELQALREKYNALKKRKKFGLVWEDKPEDVAVQCERQLPVLREVENKVIAKNADPQSPTHILIEGDNFHALSVLNYTHKGKIDGIYIDPPYNTGNTTWIYNNKIIDGNDTYKHSKWLSMMEKRLLLAKQLLKDNGIIVVTIDDHEFATLNLLLNEIFEEENHLGTIVIKNNPSGRSTASGFSIAHEYALFYSKSSEIKIGRLKRTEKQISRYGEKDCTGCYEWVNFRKHGGYKYESPKMYYPICLNINKNLIRVPSVEWNEIKKEWIIFDEISTDEVVVFPKDEEGRDRRWKWSIERTRAEISEMKIGLDRTKQPAVYIKSRMKDEGMLPLTWWDKTEYSATAYGNNLLMSIMGEKLFDYPKSLYAVEDCIRVITENKDAVILDFFAGSGTTGHAVLELNKEDGGNRQFILCTNNENKICEEVTYPRIKNVIKGYGNTEGIPANLRYFKTDFVNSEGLSNLSDHDKENLTRNAGEMIALKENCFCQKEMNDWWQIFENDKKVTAIYFKESKQQMSNLLKKLKNQNKKCSLYIFSWAKGKYKEYESKNIKVEDIPEPILEIYKEINKIGKGEK